MDLRFIIKALIAALLVPLAAYCWRVRGSGLGENWPKHFGFRGDRLAKLAIGAFPMFLVCLLLGVVWWQALLVWLVTAGLDTGWKHGEATSLGHWPPNAQEWPYWKGALVLVASGLVFTLPVALATWYPWFLLGGAAMWLAYDLGWRLNLKTPEFRGPELGEWLTGAFRTLPTLGAILWG